MSIPLDAITTCICCIARGESDKTVKDVLGDNLISEKEKITKMLVEEYGYQLKRPGCMGCALSTSNLEDFKLSYYDIKQGIIDGAGFSKEPEETIVHMEKELKTVMADHLAGACFSGNIEIAKFIVEMENPTEALMSNGHKEVADWVRDTFII